MKIGLWYYLGDYKFKYKTMKKGIERSLVILKPDAVQRGLVGEVLSRFEKKGLKITAMKMLVGTEDQYFQHYNKDDQWFKEKGESFVKNREEKGMPVEKEAIEYGKDIIRSLAKFMTAGPTIAFVLEGHKAVDHVTKIVGSTEPLTADVGTIRGDFSMDSYEMANMDDRGVRNVIHCSENTDEAEREIKIWFKEDELINYSLVGEKILYDVNLDGILE